MVKIIKRYITYNLEINPFPVIITIALTLLTSCATISSYQYNGLEFTVVDKNTGKPIQGVVAVAMWVLKRPAMFTNPRVVGLERAFDTVSNNDGHIKLPAWGPVTTFTSYIPYYMPYVFLYKPGYKLLSSDGGDDYTYVEYTDNNKLVNGLGFPIVKMVADRDKQNMTKSIVQLTRDMRTFERPATECFWQHFPHLISILIKERHKFQQKEWNFPNSILNAMYGPEVGCESPQKFIKKTGIKIFPDVRAKGKTVVIPAGNSAVYDAGFSRLLKYREEHPEEFKKYIKNHPSLLKYMRERQRLYHMK